MRSHYLSSVSGQRSFTVDSLQFPQQNQYHRARDRPEMACPTTNIFEVVAAQPDDALCIFGPGKRWRRLKMPGTYDTYWGGHAWPAFHRVLGPSQELILGRWPFLMGLKIAARSSRVHQYLRRVILSTHVLIYRYTFRTVVQFHHTEQFRDHLI